jgi:hypothetical protein
MRSLWYNRVQAGETRTLRDFTRDLLHATRPGREVNYALVWRDWTDVFGRGALRIMPSSNIIDEGGDIYDRFCRDVFGLAEPPPAAKRGHRVNASGGAREAEMIRALNALSVTGGTQPKRDMFSGYWPMRKAAEAQRIYAAMAAHEETVVLDDADPALDRLYGKLQGFTDCLTSQHGGGTIFTRQRRELAVIGQGYLADGDTETRMRVIFDDILAARARARAP